MGLILWSGYRGETRKPGSAQDSFESAAALRSERRCTERRRQYALTIVVRKFRQQGRSGAQAQDSVSQTIQRNVLFLCTGPAPGDIAIRLKALAWKETLPWPLHRLMH